MKQEKLFFHGNPGCLPAPLPQFQLNSELFWWRVGVLKQQGYNIMLA